MPINTTDADTNPHPSDIGFHIYAVDNSDPRTLSNVHFVAPPNSKLHIDLDTTYHTISHTRTDGADRPTSDYGHYFTITDPDGNTIATGVVNGLSFRTISVGVVTEQPKQADL